MSISPHRAKSEPQKIDMVVILYGTETGNYVQFRAEGCQKYALFQKKLQMKVVQN